MEIKFYCPHCEQPIEADSALDGEQVDCPNCNQVIMVPHTSIGVGMSVGGFLIKAKIGQGGMGDIYLAEQKSMGRDVALKILPPAMTRDKTFLYRFLQEIKLLGSLKHPNMVVAHDAGEDDGAYYLAMEYVQGENLTQRLDSGKPFSEEEALRITTDVCHALEYAWEKTKFIHRDIKPANIMLNQDNEVKVMDLGLAKSMAEFTNNSMTGYIVGTPQYMPPEQLTDAPLDSRSDMYSLGATLYHMLTGQEPYKSTSLMEVLSKRANDPLPSPTKYNTQISDPCLHLLEAMMSKNKQHRPESWMALRQDIQHIQQGDYPKTPRPKSIETMLLPAPKGHRRQRRKKRAIQTAQLALVLAALVALTTLFMSRIPDENTPKEAPISTVTQKPLSNIPGSLKAQIEELYTYAEELQQSQPNNLPAQLRAYNILLKDARRHEYSKYALIAEHELSALKKKKNQAIDAARKELSTQLSSLLQENKYAEALDHLQSFRSPWKNELKDALTKQQSLITKKQKDWKAQQQKSLLKAQNLWTNLIEHATQQLLKKNAYSAMKTPLKEGMENPALAAAQPQWQTIKNFLTAAEKLDQRVAQSFADKIGRPIEINLKSGPLNARVLKVSGNIITLSRRITSSGHAEQEISLSDLSTKEWVTRLGSSEEPPVAFRKGLLALRTQQYTIARKYFELVDNDLGKALTAHLLNNEKERQALENTRKEEKARAEKERDARLALAKLLEPLNLSITDEPPEGNPRSILRSLPRKKLRDIHDEALTFMEQFAETATAQKWAALLEVLTDGPKRLARKKAKIKPSKALLNEKEIIQRIKSENPSYHGGAQFTWDGPTLIKLDLSNTGISDLSPLEGLNLSELILEDCPDIDTIEPLLGLPLRQLSLDTPTVNDYRAIAELPLQSLRLFNATESILEDLAPLRLIELALEKMETDDLSAINGHNLRRLYINGSPLYHLEEMARFPHLKRLAIGACDVENLEDLKSLHLSELWLFDIPIKDLSPLANLPLKTLFLSNTQVVDLSVLRDIPLSFLAIASWENIEKGITELRNNKSIQKIGTNPWETDEALSVEDFWNRWDEGHFQ